MAENSAIAWTTHTFNPWIGCTKVGPGCDHCYAETFDKRVGGAHWGPGVGRRLVKDWSKPRKWNRHAAASGERPWVFCASMADVFDNEVDPIWRARLWDLVRECRYLRWQFVTKRIGNVRKMLPHDWNENFGHCGLLISVVNQEEANRDIPKLLATPAAWRGLSMEPLLGRVDLTRLETAGDGELNALTGLWATCPIVQTGRHIVMTTANLPPLDWVIVGGESGHHARALSPNWVRALRDQCAAHGVPFFFKQWGEFAPVHETRAGEPGIAGKLWVNFDPDTAVCRIGTKAAGRRLDGVEHNAMPRAA